jgi:hypothetical protein
MVNAHTGKVWNMSLVSDSKVEEQSDDLDVKDELGITETVLVMLDLLVILCDAPEAEKWEEGLAYRSWRAGFEWQCVWAVDFV